MNSKITIEVDFDNNNSPVLQVLLRPSDDIRDKLVKSFIEKLGSQSSWCTIKCVWTHQDRSEQWLITPISEKELPLQSRLMAAFSNVLNPTTESNEYAAFELHDDNENFRGLNIFYNGQCVYTWIKPEELKV